MLLKKNYKVDLGVNVDHIATIRQARLTDFPCPTKMAALALDAGADQITVHLREDRRHIQEYDVINICKLIDEKYPNALLNLEMALTEKMLNFALQIKPDICCFVPEKREELTTEGGLDLTSCKDKLQEYIIKLAQNNIKSSLFIDADIKQIDIAKQLEVFAIELHTGCYADAKNEQQALDNFNKLKQASEYAFKLGIKVHAGHGLNYTNVAKINEIKQITELNIGHAIVAKAFEVGMFNAVKLIRELIN